MKLKLSTLDKFLLLLIGFSILVDMVNGFFIREFVKIPLGQAYKIALMLLMLIRLLPTKDLLPILFISVGFQIAPLAGFLKTGSTTAYVSDVIVATKWIMVPLSFFYFKTIFKSANAARLYPHFQRAILLSFGFLSLNMLLGGLGLGSAFYYDGFPNASGTKGFIYAGNELTIFVLVLGFLIAAHLRQAGQHFKNLLFFTVFLLFAFLITSKTVIGGVAIVFLIPYLSSIKTTFSRKWVDWMIGLFVVGLPALVGAFYYGITKSGFLRTLQYNAAVNEDPLTILLSNRNNFVEKGWEVFTQDYNVLEKIWGLGEHYHLALSENLAELDFMTLLFSNGIFGLLLLLFLLLFYFLNSRLLMRKKGYVHAQPVFVFLLFLCLAANSAGHVFNSGIAGTYIGAAIAMMFYTNERYQKKQNRLNNTGLP